jgi:hypothetical protein
LRIDREYGFRLCEKSNRRVVFQYGSSWPSFIILVDDVEVFHKIRPVAFGVHHRYAVKVPCEDHEHEVVWEMRGTGRYTPLRFFALVDGNLIGHF